MRAELALAGKHVGGRVAAGLHRMFGSRAAGAFGILMYHRITDARSGVPAPTWNVTPSRFCAQIEGLLARGYRFLPLRSIIERARHAMPIPPKTVGLTIDDGYQNAYVHAWPILRRLKVPAAVFVSTAFLDTAEPQPFDRWGWRERERVPVVDWRALTWAHCREMEQSGLIEIGSHSHEHFDYRHRPEALRRDIALSLSTLKEQLGPRDFMFSFPYGERRLGYAGEELMRVAWQSGALCALTTDAEIIPVGSSHFGWGRFEVLESDTPATLEAKLEGWYAWMGRAKDVFRFVLPPGSDSRELSDADAAR